MKDKIARSDAQAAIALAKKAGGGGGSLIPIPTAQDAGKMLIVGVVQGEAGYQLVAFDEPMKFKGTLGTGGTITTLPAASSANNGFTYLVIADGTYAGQEADAGDQFISNGEAWWRIPSGDEASVIDDTVTSTALTWSSDKIASECKVKSFTYIGNGSTTNTIKFPSKPSLILGIEGLYDSSQRIVLQPTMYNKEYGIVNIVAQSDWGTVVVRAVPISYNDDEITITSTIASRCLNVNSATYTVFYI